MRKWTIQGLPGGIAAGSQTPYRINAAEDWQTVVQIRNVTAGALTMNWEGGEGPTAIGALAMPANATTTFVFSSSMYIAQGAILPQPPFPAFATMIFYPGGAAVWGNFSIAVLHVVENGG